MPTQVLLAVLGLLAGGVFVLLLGLRGRRINRDPACRDCGFNLAGVVPAGVTCPECGAGLKRRGAVRIGQRRRMPVVVGLGVLLGFTGLVPLGLAGYAALTGTNVDTYKPVGVLLWELRRANATRSGAIADELLSRMLAGMPEPEERQVVEAVLAVQAQPARPWTEKLGDLIERARLDSRVTDEQMDQLRRNAAVFEVEVRPRVRAGDALPVAVRVKEARLGAGMAVQVMVQLTGSRLGENALARAPAAPDQQEGMAVQFGLLGGGDSAMMFMLSGSKSQFRWNQWGEEQVGCIGPVPEDQAPGPVALEVGLAVMAHDLGRPAVFNWSAEGEGSQKPSVRFEKTVHVVGKDQDAVERVGSTEETTASMVEKLRPSSVQAYSFDEDQAPMLQMQLDLDGLPAPLAHEVIVRSGQRRWRVGSVTSGRGDSGQNMGFQIGGVGMGSRHVANQLKNFDLDKVDIVLKPKAELVLRSVDQTRMYDGEIVIEGVDVQWPQGKPSKDAKQPKGAKSFWRLLLGG